MFRGRKISRKLEVIWPRVSEPTHFASFHCYLNYCCDFWIGCFASLLRNWQNNFHDPLLFLELGSQHLVVHSLRQNFVQFFGLCCQSFCLRGLQRVYLVLGRFVVCADHGTKRHHYSHWKKTSTCHLVCSQMLGTLRS